MYTNLIKERANERSSSATDGGSTTGGVGINASVTPRSEAMHSGESQRLMPVVRYRWGPEPVLMVKDYRQG